MSAINLDKMFHPKSIAVVGASQRDGSIGSDLMRNLIQGGYPGEIYPINPNHKTIWELPAYPSLPDLKSQVDLTILTEPITSAPQIVKECAEAGVGGLVIISTGRKETGAKDRELELAIKNKAEHSGLRVIGPNCFGIISSRSNLNASLSCHMPLPGKMAFISQSGAICSSVLDLSIREHIGFSYFVSLGSMHDVDFVDIVDYIGKSFEVNGIVMYIEHLGRFRNFMSAVRSVSRVKPIVVLKAGRTRPEDMDVTSYNTAFVDKDAVYNAAFKRAGIVRVKTFEELFDCARLLAKQPRPKGPGLAIVTNTASLGSMASDALFDYDMAPVSLSLATIEKLDQILDRNWSRKNPVVFFEDVSPECYGQVVNACLKAPEVKGLLLIITPQTMADPFVVATYLADHLKGKPYPILTSWMGGPDVEKQREIFNRAGLTTFDTPERAVRAFINLFRYSQNIELLQEIPPKLPKKMEFDRERAHILIQEGLLSKNHLLTEGQTKALLAAYGIPVNLIEMDFSYKDAEQKIEKYELAIGSKTDRDFGPVIFFGIGGIMTGIFKDQSIALPPLNRLLARRLMEETKIYHLLKGYRDLPPANLALLEEILIRLSQLVTDFPEIVELNINPLIVTKNDVCAMDASLLLEPTQVQAPLHLVISPYPNQYETRIEHGEVGELFIRPIRPEDAPLMVQLFESLSPQSIHFRFFGPLKQLPHSMLARFTQIDYDREIALVALCEAESDEKMLGVARVITEINGKHAEFSVIVGDPWHGKGIGAELLKRCLSIAKERGIEKVKGLVLPENTQMLALGRKLEFSVKRVPGKSEYELCIDLQKL